MDGELALADRVATLLRCMAVDHRVGGLLVLTADPRLLHTMARWLARTMATDSGARPPIVVAGSWLAEDDLWMRVRLDEGRLRTAPGLLTDGPVAPIVVVPDLARAGLGVLRAAVTLVGASVASVERHGYSRTWRPRARWLAAVDPAAAAGLSPHLLDRFPLRIAAPDGPAAGLPEPEPLARAGQPVVPPVAADALQELSRGVGGGMRRSLAVARTARAVAVLEGAAEVTAGHVRGASALLGLAVAPVDADPPEDADPDGDAPPGAAEHTPEPAPPDGPVGGAAAVSAGDPPVPVAAAGPGLSMYPEDAPDALPEAMSLRIPWTSVNRERRQRGQNTGVERTRRTADIALVPTLLQAAKFRAVRPAAGGIVVRREDWRQYRRGWSPNRLLVLVLDHTCRRDWDWIPALSGYLQWAYVQRAAVCVVDLGHADAADLLRAERYLAASVRDPRLLRSLYRPPGRATPLASGIQLAGQELLRLTRRGRTTVDRAWLVVATDGRGNVPLEASARGRVDGPAGRRGVDDALSAAAAVKAIASVRTVVLAPRLATYANLPFDLADALGGVVAATDGAAPTPYRQGLRT